MLFDKFEQLEEFIKDDKKIKDILKECQDKQNKNAAESVKNIFGRKVTEMYGFEPGSNYNGKDLLAHSLHAVLNIQKGSEDDCLWVDLRIAALFHDIGKLGITGIRNDDGSIRFPGHAKKSSEIVGSILKIEDDLRKERIRFFIENHDAFDEFTETDSFESENNLEERIIDIVSKEIRVRTVTQSKFVPGINDYRNLISLCRANEKAKAVETALKNGKKPDHLTATDSILKKHSVKSCKPMNRSYICVPFVLGKNSPSIKNVGEYINSDIPGIKTESMNECCEKLLRYVAGRFNCDRKSNIDSNDVCIVRRINALNAFGVNVLGNDAKYSVSGLKSSEFRIKSIFIFCFKTGVNILVEGIEFADNNYIQIANNLFHLRDISKREKDSQSICVKINENEKEITKCRH